MGRPSDRPPFLLPCFLLPRFYCRILVILNLFQDNVPPLVILKQVQDDENALDTLKQVQDDEKELGTETP